MEITNEKVLGKPKGLKVDKSPGIDGLQEGSFRDCGGMSSDLSRFT